MVRKIIFLIAITIAWPQNLIEVNIDKTKINEGDTFNLIVTSKNESQDLDIRLPKMDRFKIISGPNISSSTSIQIVNGKMTKMSTKTYTWVLLPLKIGKSTIPSLKIMAGKELHTSKSISIEVTKRSDLTSKNSQFFIEAEVDNIDPYRGEQIILSYILYTKVDISSFEDDLPKYKGFWTEELFSAKKLQLYEVKKGNSKYYAATIKKIALFPTKSGKLKIEPLSAIIGVREKQQRWNDFSLFGPPPKKYTIATNTIELEVQPLPKREKGKVSAVIGDWDISSNISKTRLQQDEALTYNIVIKGTGNLYAIDMSNIKFPVELEVFDPKIETKKNPLRDKIGGEKVFEWVFIPRYPGDIIIPSIDFNYFDPIKEEWVTKSTTKYKLEILPNQKSGIIPLGLSKEEIILVGKDIRFIDESKPRWRNLNARLTNRIAIVLIFLSCLVLFIPFIYSYTQFKIDNTFNERQARKAFKIAEKNIISSNSSIEAVYTSIYKSIVIYINLKLGKNRLEYSTDEIINLINLHSESEIEIVELQKILKNSEAARFSQSSINDAQLDSNKVKLLLKKIDNDWL